MKEKAEAEKGLITIYWWNLGIKVLDFEGTYKEFFSLKNITSKSVKTGGYVFRIPLSSNVTTFRTTDIDYKRGANEAIKIFMTLLDHSQTYKVNWY